MFLGDVSAERQVEVRRAVEDVMSFFDDRYGVVVPEFKLYLSPDPETASAQYTGLTGREPPPSWGGFVAEGREGTEDELLAFLAGWWVTTGDDELREILAHEYFHLIQFSVLRAAGVSRSSPEWLIEGTAVHNEELYLEDYTDSETSRTHRLIPLRNAGPFRDIADSFGHGWYEIAGLAIDWLVARSGNPGASLEYWRSLAEEPDWSKAFESAFTITPEGFFEAFEEHRTAIAASAPRIRGVVLDPDGNVLGGVHINASAGNTGPRSVAVTGDDGTFEMVVPEGNYFIKLGRVAPTASGFPTGGIFFSLFYSAETGYANSCALTEVEAGTTDLAVRVLPELLQRVDEPPCNEGVPGHYVIESTVLGPDGETILGDSARLEGVGVSADPLVLGPGGLSQGPAGIGTDGKARTAVPDGRYVLVISEFSFSTGSRRLGWYGGATGFTTDRAEATVIEVDGANVTGIQIHLPADPADLPTIE